MESFIKSLRGDLVPILCCLMCCKPLISTDDDPNNDIGSGLSLFRSQVLQWPPEATITINRHSAVSSTRVKRNILADYQGLHIYMGGVSESSVLYFLNRLTRGIHCITVANKTDFVPC